MMPHKSNFPNERKNYIYVNIYMYAKLTLI